MSAFSATAFARGGKAVALSVAFGIVLAFVPFLSVIAVPAMPIPVAYIASKHGMAAGLAASVVAGAICVVLTGLYAGLLVFLLAAVVGGGIGLGLRRGISQRNLFLSVAALFTVALALWAAVLLVNAGLGPVAATQRLTDTALVPARDIYIAIGMNEEEADSAANQAREFAEMIPYIIPATLLVLSLALSGATVTLARRAFDRLKQPFPRDYKFQNLRLHFSLAYLMIAGLLCELLTPYVPESYSSAVSLTGMNLLIASEALFFVQGLAIANFFLNLYRVSRPKRVGVYLGLILLQLVLSATSWVGLFDTWIDYRRRFGRKKTKGQAG